MILDYAEIWRQSIKNKTSSGNQYKENPETAKAYNNSPTIWMDGYKRANEFAFGLNDTVLDIGSGPGVLSIPLAHKVKGITAIEPSETMISLLLEHAKKENISNINVISGTWPEASYSIGKYDHVIASYSLMMSDIKEAIIAMDNTAIKSVTLYWFSGLTEWDKISVEFYPIIYGKQYVPGPKSDIIYGVLSELGISADILSLKDTEFNRRFDDTFEAILDLRKRLNVDDDRWDSKFIEYIEKNYRKLGNGWEYVDRTNYVKISWCH